VPRHWLCFSCDLKISHLWLAWKKCWTAFLGIGKIEDKLKLPIKSPFFEHYFGKRAIGDDPQAFTN